MADKYVAIDSRQLDAFVRDLRRSGSDLPKQIRVAQKEVVDEVADWGKQDLSRESHPTQRHVARLKAIRSKVSGRSAAVRIDAKAKRNAMALGAVFGAKKFAQFPRYQDPGKGWPTGGYPPFSTVRDREQDIVDMFLDATDDALRPAFPD
jgi:hypothetical protein